MEYKKEDSLFVIEEKMSDMDDSNNGMQFVLLGYACTCFVLVFFFFWILIYFLWLW